MEKNFFAYIFYSCSIMLICAAAAFAGYHAAGIVVCAQTGQPLDSVRVSSAAYRTASYTQSDGRFVLECKAGHHGTTESQRSDGCMEFTIVTSVNDRSLQIVTRQSRSPRLALFDLHGRCMEQTTMAERSITFPQRNLPSGMYLLKIDGLQAMRLLVSGRHDGGIVDRNHRRKSVHKSDYDMDDTILFYRDGYAIEAVTAGSLKADSMIRLSKKRWLASDIHNHSVLTDGSFIEDSVLAHSFGEGGLDVVVNSEHGGLFYRDTAGSYIADDPGRRSTAPWYGGSIYLPRWYTLINYSWPKILGQRKHYPEKILLQGMEWNCPGHEHASVGFINDADQPQAVAEFEYRFDADDPDTSVPLLRKNNRNLHSDAIAALSWLNRNYQASSYFYINHPSREAVGRYNVEHFRDFNNAAPIVFLGFEGMPGHHKNPNRGSYGQGDSTRNRTWGGADHVLACVGGKWDALLGEGRHIWTIVNSDFHVSGSDFWPGVYAKTWTAVTDTGARAWLEGMRSGEMFITNGDLISELEFTIDDGIKASSMGDDLWTDTTTLAVTIRFRSPKINNHRDSVQVDHIDLISGLITGKIDSSSASDYRNPVNNTTRVLQRYSAKNWTSENGYNVIRAMVPFTQPAYFRLRGTSLAVGTPGEVDSGGNPLMDEDYLNTEQIAWKDLWFYSNPVFVYRR